MVGLSGLEPLTSRLSGVCSNQLSYKPVRRLRDRGALGSCILELSMSSADAVATAKLEQTAII